MKNILVEILLENTKTSMSFNQYKLYKDGQLSLADIKFINRFDKQLGEISPEIYKGVVIGIATVMFYSNTVYAADGLEKIDSVGSSILTIAQKICYWVCLIMGVTDVMKELFKGDVIHNYQDIGKVIIKYILAFASVYFMPYAFDTIKDLF